MFIKVRSLTVGMATCIPGLRSLSARRTGGTISARYCYSIWLRHLVTLHRATRRATFDTVVELGPGDSLGTGLAALLSGAQRYVALDAWRYSSAQRDLDVFDELIGLFRARAPVPDEDEFPRVRPLLPSYAFPAEILTQARMDAALDPARLAAIRAAVGSPASTARQSSSVCYIAPWRPEDMDGGTADLVLSQTVLEYPAELRALYSDMSRWLKPDGAMSHEIDFTSMGTTHQWNGHWACSDLAWRLVAGRRKLITNREPHSTHLELLERAGCRVVTDQRTVQSSDIARSLLAPRFVHLTDDDLTTTQALIQAVKEPGTPGASASASTAPSTSTAMSGSPRDAS